MTNYLFSTSSTLLVGLYNLKAQKRAERRFSMNFEGALLKEQGVTFAIVVVQPHVLDSTLQMQNARTSFGSFFPRVPIILMAQNGRGTPTYQGRTDIVQFLSHVHPSRIPWKRYTVN